MTMSTKDILSSDDTNDSNHNNNNNNNNNDDDDDTPFPPPIPKNLHPLSIETIKPTRQKTLEQNPFRTIKFLVKTFSTNSRQRHPSWAAISNTSSDTTNSATRTPKTRHVRLITIGPSHYAEKIRWALDLLEADPQSDIYYTEDAHPPALASLASVYASQDAASVTPMIVIDPSSTSSSSSTSKLPISDSSRVLYESSTILPHLHPQLYPPQHKTKITSMEQWLGATLGAAARCVAYHYLFQSKSSAIIRIATGHTSYIERRIWTVMYKTGLVEKRFRKFLGVNEESAARSLGVVKFVFQVVSDMLALNGDTTTSGNHDNSNDNNSNNSNIPKKEYLFDTGFSAADLTFASLASLLIAPPELAAFQVSDDDMPSELIRIRTELRNTLAGRHVLEMYRKHRFAICGSYDNDGDDDVERGRIVVPKVVGRDRIPWTFVIGLAGVSLGVFFTTTGSPFHSKL